MKLKTSVIGIAFHQSADRKRIARFTAPFSCRVVNLFTDGKFSLPRENIDLVIIDHEIAQTHQTQLIDLKNKAARDLGFTPVIIGLPEGEDPNIWLEAGFDDMITLPLKQENLTQRLSVWLRLQAKVRGHFQTLYESSVLGVYRTTPDGEILLANPALVTMLGYDSLAELQNRNLESEGFEPGYERSEFRRKLEQDGVIRGLEAAWKRKDGATVYVRESARLIKDQLGKILYYEGTVEDITRRKEAETQLRNTLQDLKASEEELEVTLRSIGDAVIATDKAGNVTLMNPVAEALTGWTEAEARGRSLQQVFNIFNEDTGEKMEDPVTRVMREQKVIGLANHTLLRHRKGHEIPIADSGAPIRNADQEIIGVVLVFRDQTEERVAQRKIEESLTRLRRAELASKSGNWELHLDTGTMIGSAGACEIYGVKGDRFQYQYIKEIPLPEYRSMMDKALKNLIEKNIPYDIEFKIKSADTGQIKDIHSQAFYDRERKTLFGTIRDITEQKRIQNEIVELKDFNASILQDMAEGLVVVDERGNIEYVNPATETLLGYSRKDLLGQPASMIIPRDQLQIVIAEDKKRKKKRSSVYELQMVRKDGKRIDLRVSGSPRFKEGKFIGTMAVFTDITESKATLKALEASEAFNRAVLRSVSEGIVVFDRNFRYLVWNTYMESSSGIKAESILGKCAFDVFPFLKAQGLDKLMKRALNGETITGPDSRYIIPNTGREGWFVSTYAPHKGSDGQIKGVVVWVQDITERKRVEKEQEILLTELQLIFDASPIPIFVVDSDQKIQKANKATELVADKKAQDILGRRGGDVFRCIHALAVPEGCGFGPECQSCVIRNTVLDTFHTKKPAVNVEAELTLSTDQDSQKHYLRLSTSYFTGSTGPRVVVTMEDVTDRRQAAQQLMDSEEKYRQLVENANEAIFVIQGDKLVFANPMTNQIAGYSNDILFQKPFLEFVYPDDREIVYKNYISRLEGERTADYFLVRILDKTQTVIWLSIRSIKIDWEGQPATLNFASDITERRQIEEALMASEKKYRTLFEKSRDAILIIENGMFTECNQATVDMLGYGSKEELLQTHPSELSPPKQPDGRDSVEKADEMMALALEKGSHRFEWDHQRANGEVFPVEVLLTAISTEPGNQVIHTVWRDITDRKKAEQELRNSEKKFREVIEQSSDGIYILWEHRFVFINPRFTEITGYQLDDINGEDFDFKELVAEESQAVIREREAMRQRGEKPPSRFVFTIRRKDGEKRDMEASITTIEWQGNPGTLGILHDVTDRLRTQRELEKALERAKQGERVKNLFIANMSHEIRTPLNAILGFSGLLQEKFSHLIGEDERQFFEAIESGGQRLMRTVHEILDISQIDAGAYTLNREKLDLYKLVNGLVFDHQIAARSKNLKLTFQAHCKTAYIRADKYSITQAISNILDNAIKYTNRGGITVSLVAQQKKYIVTIRDTGIGIDKRYINTLFEAFTQESEGYTKKFQGIGLGMAITKRHLDLNQVGIQVDSEKGVGTSFILTFAAISAPLRKTKRKPEPTAVRAVEGKHRPRLLVVEDDRHSRELVSFFLKSRCDVCFAISVSEAKAQLKSHKIDLILLDLSLIGNEDGLDLVRWMRKTKTWAGLPVIATTAHAMTTDRDNCIAAGCNNYLSKPISREKLLTMVDQFLNNP